ncbi:hypothetical protein V1477_019254 [Vespula maculifrons]|uniref:Uncharacterized protein n=1 Tax=Vespula maculifrons TaxID=7453 RepID=A0ABD2AS20_VESMC
MSGKVNDFRQKEYAVVTINITGPLILLGTTGSSNTSTLIRKCEEISFDTSTLLQDPNQNGGLSSFGGVMSYAARTLAS